VNQIAVIDTHTNRVTGFVPIYATGIAFDPRAAFAYAISDIAGDVSVIDTATRSVVGAPISLGVGASPWSIAVNSDGTRAYVNNKKSVAVIDLAKKQLIDAVPTGDRDVALSLDGHFAYVTPYTGSNPDTVDLAVIDTSTDTVIDMIPICATDPMTDVEPDEILVAPDGQRLYVACAAGINVINLSTHHVIITVPGIGGSDNPSNSATLTPDGAFLYGLEYSDCSEPTHSDEQCPVIPVMDTATNTVSATIFSGGVNERIGGIAITSFPCRSVPLQQGTVTPTPTPVPCVGDCNGSGQVTIDEILSLVNIALGNAEVASCEAGDANLDGQITIDEILTAVNNALTGCG